MGKPIRSNSAKKGEITRAIRVIVKHLPGPLMTRIVLEEKRRELIREEQADVLEFLKTGIADPVPEDARFLRRMARILEQLG